MMTCREVADFLMDYLDGNLADRERALFEEHLAVCSPCVAYLRSYRETMRFEQTLTSAGSDVPEPLVQAILAARQ